MVHPPDTSSSMAVPLNPMIRSELLSLLLLLLLFLLLLLLLLLLLIRLLLLLSIARPR